MLRAPGALALAVVILSSACGVEPGPADDIQQTQAALVGTDSFLYFRSNATGWGVDESTRLFAFAPSVFARTYSGIQTWMISDADTAIVTETNQLDGWGTTQVFSGAASKRIVVPGTDALAVQQQGGDAHFKVKYAQVGQHRALVNLNVSPATITIESTATVCGGVFCPSGLHCELFPNGLPTCVVNPGPPQL
jgi:hypothetical protein